MTFAPGLLAAAALALSGAVPAAMSGRAPSPAALAGASLRAPGVVAPRIAAARPIRTNEPGTGVFIGSGTLGRLRIRREVASTGEVLREAIWVSDIRYTPATHWVFGVALPIVHRSMSGGTLDDDSSAGGVGDLLISGKYRFFRTVGRWSDRHAAVEVGVKLPTGSTTEPVNAALALPLQRRLQPGTGSTDFVFDLVYQEGRRRFVYGGDLAYVLSTADANGYAFGDALRLSLDFEYIVLPLEYRRPGHEVFLLLEAAVSNRRRDRLNGMELATTGRTEILLAPAVQYIATERLLVSFSAQFPVYADVPPGGLGSDFDFLGEFRYAF